MSFEVQIPWIVREEIELLRAELEEARAVLREVEWCGRDGWDPPNPCCPLCPGHNDEIGHAPDCRLWKVIGE